MIEAALKAVGFAPDDDGSLQAPDGSTTVLTPTGNFYELRIVLADGNAIVAVLSKSALKITRDRAHEDGD